MKKKILSIVLTFSMLISVLTILPIQIGATEGNATEIGSVEKWLELSQKAELTGDYVLTADLDFTGKEFSYLQKFSAGTFDGQGHTITGISYTLTAGLNTVGLFRVLSTGATVKNLVITNSSIATQPDRGAVGVVSGDTEGEGEILIQNIYVDKSVTVTAGSGGNAGGILGISYGKTAPKIENCVFAGTVNSSGDNNGGFVGNGNGRVITISNCMNLGTITSTGGWCSGFIGRDDNASTVIENSVKLGSAKNYTFAGSNSSSKKITVKDSYYLGTMTNKNVTATNCTELTDVAQLVGNDVSADITAVLTEWTMRDGDVIVPTGVAGFDLPQWYDGEEWSGSGTETDPYTIANANQWIYFANFSASETFEGKYIRLTADIDFKGASIHTAFCEMEGKTFAGNFDGDGHVLSNFTIATPDASASLFGRAGGTAVLKNLLIKNATIDAGKWAAVLFGEVGTNANLTVENVYVDSDVTLSATGENCGGIVGGCYGSAVGVTVKNSVFAGTIVSNGSNIGGFVGNGNYTTVSLENCLMLGSVKGTGEASGFVGINNQKSDKSKAGTTTLTGCVYAGTGYTTYPFGNFSPATYNETTYFSISNCYTFLGEETVAYKTGDSLTNPGAGVTAVDAKDYIGKTLVDGWTVRTGDIAVPTTANISQKAGVALKAKQEYGASVRIDTTEADTSGIRFTGFLTDAYIAELEAGGKDYTYGMIIAPVDYIKKCNDFTKAELDNLTITGAKYQLVEAVKTIDNEGYVSFNCAIGKIQEHNLSRSFAARIYVCVDGEYTYFGYLESENARSVTLVAERAYNDLSDTQTEEYAYAVTIDGITKYSCYTDAQRAVLERYMQRRETV